MADAPGITRLETRRVMAADADRPSHGWFTVDLDDLLADLRTEREGAVVALLRRPRPEPPPAEGPRRVPAEAIVQVWRCDPAPLGPVREPPAREVIAFPAGAEARPRLTRREGLLAALLGLALAGLAWQQFAARPAIVVPVSLDAGVVVT